MARSAALLLKRGIDLAGAAAAIVLLSPVLAWTSLAIAATMGRPIFFRQVRPGLHGELFQILKFRTMRPTKPGEVWYMTDDERITRLGRFLRSTSIDELPELWNVLRGEMSLVGPRPLLVEYLETYSPDERRRHDMRPGITGWAAVNGRHVLKFDERLRLDTWYVDNWSLALDLRIVAMTVSQVLRRADTDAIQDLAEVGFRLPGADGWTPTAAAVADGEGPAARPHSTVEAQVVGDADRADAP
jgi:lipopolysaccharide/colanic/teichoic acid biosynthesis glycosyltransferase